MSRIFAVGALSVIGWALSPPCFGQTSSNQSRDRRLEATESDITLLKRVVKEQDRRIAELEKIIKALQGQATTNSDKPPTARELAKTMIKPEAPWHNPFAWAQIREGMSRAQVEDILGNATSVESVIDHQTLIYKGDVPGSGTVSGIVKLTDDRVSEISSPNF